MSNPGVWFQYWERPADPPCRLVCFPHAGGSASFYRAWAEHLPPVEVCAVRYPGRAERIDEPPATDLRSMARNIAKALAALPPRPAALFGHSLGAAVALETARALEAGGVPVAHLFASGSRDAPLPEPAEPAEDIDEREAVRQLARMGGTSRDMLDDPAFRELVLPYVMADTQMFHAYRMTPEPVLRCPVTVLTGDRDDEADLRPWSTLTAAPVEHRTVRGDHFYLIGEPPYDVVRATLSGTDSARVQEGWYAT